MTDVPPPRDPGDVDEWYWRAASSDRSHPSETVRQAVLDHAAQLAASHASRLAATRADEVPPVSASGRRRSSWGWRGPAVAGTLAAALAAVMLLPRFLPPPADVDDVPASPASTASPAPVANPAASTSAGAPGAQAPAAAAPTARAPTPAPTAPAPTARFVPRSDEPSSFKEDAGRAQSNARSARDAAPAVTARESSFAKRAIAEAPETGAMSQSQAMSQLQANSRAQAGTNPKGTDETAAALRHAAEVGDLSALETLLQKPVDIDSRDSLGRTALMLATLHGQINTATALLGHGADPNAADARGTTPLEAARAGDHPDVAAALTRYGAR